MKSAFAPVTIILLVFSLAVPGAANAQGIKVGPQVGINLGGSDIFVGLETQFSLPIMENREVWGNIGFDFYPFIDKVSVTSINVDVLFPFNVGGVELYGGGGLLVKSFKLDLPADSPIDDKDTDIGLDLKAGWIIGSPGDGYRPFVEINQTLGAGSDFIVRGGVFIAIGGR